MNVVVASYVFYVSISVGLTVWVARTLHKNGRIFLVDVFHGNEPLADSVNHLLVVGFYLINLGYVSLALKLGYTVATTQEGIEALSVKVGMVLLVGVGCTSSICSSSAACAAARRCATAYHPFFPMPLRPCRRSSHVNSDAA